jgi:excisionase family DNA binding protein
MNEKSLSDEKLLTLKETLEYLRIGRTTLYRFMDDNKVKGHKVGGTWRFWLGELRSFVNGEEAVNDVESKDEQRGTKTGDVGQRD